ncbi:MAG: hypothetical protein AB1641_27590 [Thermodesulfobacteriota bacterium]
MLPRKIVWYMLLVMLAATAGCSHMPFLRSSEPLPPINEHFTDVQVPGDLKLDRNSSFVFETSGFKAGTLFFSGYVDAESVVSFFKGSMPKDGWRLKTVFRHPKTMLLFEKETKSCIISVYEKTIMTRVEVWVAPQVRT